MTTTCRTVDMVRTRFGGSEAMPRTPTEADPRSIVARSKLEQDARLKTMWAGYAFSRDYREGAATPTCSRIRPTPSASRPRLNLALAYTAMLRFTSPAKSSARAI